MTAPRATGTTLTGSARMLLAAYPPWWRRRYGDEMRETLLLAEGAQGADGSGGTGNGRSWDLLRGLIEAWVDPSLAVTSEHPAPRSRRHLVLSAWGLFLFLVASSAFFKLLDAPALIAAEGSDRGLGLSRDLLVAAATLLAFVLALSAVPVIVKIAAEGSGAAKRALGPSLGLLAAVVFFVLSGVVAVWIAEDGPLHRDKQILAFLLLAGAGVVASAVSTVALMRIALQAPETRAVAVSRQLAATAAAVLVGVSTAAVVSWIVLTSLNEPRLLRSDDGLIATPTLPNLVLIAAGLGAATVLCGLGAWRVVRDRT